MFITLKKYNNVRNPWQPLMAIADLYKPLLAFIIVCHISSPLSISTCHNVITNLAGGQVYILASIFFTLHRPFPAFVCLVLSFFRLRLRCCLVTQFPLKKARHWITIRVNDAHLRENVNKTRFPHPGVSASPVFE